MPPRKATGKPDPKTDPATREYLKPNPTVDELIAEAQPAENKDTEEMLRELEQLAAVRSRWTSGDYNEEYERLRDEAAFRLREGNRIFVDSNGVKTVAIRQTARGIEVDLNKLRDRVGPALLDKVAPRKIDPEAFKRAVATGKITPGTFLEVATFKPRTPYVRFVRVPDE